MKQLLRSSLKTNDLTNHKKTTSIPETLRNATGQVAAVFFSLGLLLCTSFEAKAQPTVFGTQLPAGNYATFTLKTIVSTVFGQYRTQATGSIGNGSWEWQFVTGTAGTPNYSTNWRPYTSGNTLLTNTIIPTSYSDGARYNTGSGGQPGLLPAITSGNYYTFNVTLNGSSSNIMEMLETTFNPITLSSATVSQSPISSAVTYGSAVTVSINPSANTSSGENLFLRYTTNNYTSSTLVAFTLLSGTTYTAQIPSQAAGTAVSYYVFSSNRSSTAIGTDESSNGEIAYDMATLNLNNNSGANYNYTVIKATPTVTVTPGTYTYNGSAQGPASGVTSNTGTGTSYTFSYAGTGGTSYTASATPPTRAGTYTVTATVAASGDGNWTANSSSATAFTISPKPLTASLTNTGVTKVYDGTTSAPAGFTPTYSFSGFVSGDNGATLTNSGSAYNSAHVASATTVTVSGLSISSITGSNGSVAGDYSLSSTSLNVAATITAKSLTPSLTNTGVTKVYDGTTSAPAGFTPTYSFTGLVPGDASATLTNSGSAYNNANVASATTVTVSGLTISGITGSNSSAASDYSLSTSSLNVAATITPATATINVTGYNVTYDGNAHTANGTATGVSSENLNSYLNLSATTHTAAGTYNGDGWSFGGNSNYSTASGSVNDAIGQKALSITANNITKCSGATYTFAGTEFTTAGLVPGDAVSSVTLTSAGAPASATAGVYSITASAAVGTGLSNYNITYNLGLMTVETLSLTMTQVNPDCYGDPGSLSGSVTGGTSPYMYTVNTGLNYDPTAIVYGPSTTPLYSPAAPGYYTYSVTDAAGCMAIAARLSVNALTQTAVLLGSTPAPPTTQVCYGGTKTITTIPIGGATPYTYSLNTNGVSGPFVPSANRYFAVPAGSYYITVKDNVGCTYTTNSMSITQPSAGVSFTTSIGGQACNALGGITVTAAGGYGGYTYSDNNGSSYQPGNMFNGLVYGNYTVAVKDQNGCAATSAVVKFTTLTSTAITAGKNPVCTGATTTISTVPSGGTAPYSYSLDGLAYVPSNSRYFSVQAGTHTITVKDNVSCTYGPLSINITTGSCSGLVEGGTGQKIETDQLMFAAHVMPNPAPGAFHLQMESSSKEDVELTVTNMLGVKVYEGRGGIGNAYEFGAGFASGMYILQIRQGNEVHTVKLVKGN